MRDKVTVFVKSRFENPTVATAENPHLRVVNLALIEGEGKRGEGNRVFGHCDQNIVAVLF
jgi:hypothetical protein